MKRALVKGLIIVVSVSAGLMVLLALWLTVAGAGPEVNARLLTSKLAAARDQLANTLNLGVPVVPAPVAGAAPGGTPTGSTSGPIGVMRAASSLGSGDALVADGVLEPAEEVAVSAEIGGRIVEVTANVGDAVSAGDTLVRLDNALILAQLDQAGAAIAAAQANVALAKAGARPQEIDAADAAVDSARALAEGADAAAAAASANVDAAAAKTRAAQAKYTRLAAGATPKELELANKNVELAKTRLWAAQATRDALRNGIDLPLSIPLVIKGENLGSVVIANPVGPTRADVESAETRIVEAEGAIQLAELAAEKLKQGASREELAVAQMVVKQAEADAQLAQLVQEQAQQAAQIAKAQLEQAQAQADLPLAGPRAVDVAIAEAKVAEAQAQREILQASANKLLLKTPLAGIVSERLAHEGEMLMPGARVLVVSALDPVELTVYVDEKSLGSVRLGQAVDVSVQGSPQTVLEGQVVHIAAEAEFTPRTSQASGEDSSTVFAVRIRVPNGDGRLRPGMPARARFR